MGPALDAYTVVEYDGSEKYLIAGRELHQGDVLFDRIGGIVLKKPTRHTIQVGNEHHLDVSSDLRLAHHSCDPNCRLQILDQQEPQLRITIMSPTVKPGELLTIDYNAMEIDMISPFDCVCGSSTCVGRIEGFSRLPEAVRKQYLADETAEANGSGSTKPARLTPLVRAWASSNQDK